MAIRAGSPGRGSTRRRSVHAARRADPHPRAGRAALGRGGAARVADAGAPPGRLYRGLRRSLPRRRHARPCRRDRPRAAARGRRLRPHGRGRSARHGLHRGRRQFQPGRRAVDRNPPPDAQGGRQSRPTETTKGRQRPPSHGEKPPREDPLTLAAAAALSTTALTGALAQDKSYTIGVSNGWVGPEWRTQIIQETQDAAAAWADPAHHGRASGPVRTSTSRARSRTCATSSTRASMPSW